MALARENTVFHTRFHHFPGLCSGLRSVYKLLLSFRIKTDSTAFLVDTRSKSMTPRAQGIALVVLSLKLVCLLPSCPLCHQFSCGNCFSFLKLHSFLVLMNKGGQLQASPPCWEGHFWEPAVSFLGLTITRGNSVVKFLFTHFYYLSGSGETKTKTTKVSTHWHFKMLCFASFGLGSLLCNSHHSCPGSQTSESLRGLDVTFLYLVIT